MSNFTHSKFPDSSIYLAECSLGAIPEGLIINLKGDPYEIRSRFTTLELSSQRQC
jgi:hypothetical protein